MAPRRHDSLADTIKTALHLSADKYPEILRHKGHRPTEIEIRRYRELEKRRNAQAHQLGIDPTLIASRATLNGLAYDRDKHAPELMNWQKELLK
jgi:hypothetical protein